MANLQLLSINEEQDLNGQNEVLIQWDDGKEFKYNELFSEDLDTPEKRHDYVMAKVSIIRKNFDRAEAIKAKLPKPVTPSPAPTPEPVTLPVELTPEEKLHQDALAELERRRKQKEQEDYQAEVKALADQLEAQQS